MFWKIFVIVVVINITSNINCIASDTQKNYSNAYNKFLQYKYSLPEFINIKNDYYNQLNSRIIYGFLTMKENIINFVINDKLVHEDVISMFFLDKLKIIITSIEFVPIQERSGIIVYDKYKYTLKFIDL